MALINRATGSVLGLAGLALIQGWALFGGGVGRGAGANPPWLEKGDTLGDAQIVTAALEPMGLETGSPLLLLVFHPECGHCRDAVPMWRDWIRDFQPNVTIAAVTAGSPEAGTRFLSSFDWHPEVWTVEPEAGPAVHRLLTIRTPWVFLLDEDGVILAEGHGRLIKDLASEWTEVMQFPTGQP